MIRGNNKSFRLETTLSFLISLLNSNATSIEYITHCECDGAIETKVRLFLKNLF